MKITLFGKQFNEGFKPFIAEILQKIAEHKVQLSVYKPFLDFIHCQTGFEPQVSGTFNSQNDFETHSDLIVSIGGDGTFLESIPYAVHNNIPMVGINSGRMGFLANISKDEISEAFDAIISKNYQVEQRVLICFQNPQNIFGDLNFALNEITIQKNDSSLITIDAFLDDEFLNTYWTDGLIISTPTGSTAYSLSVGGPIVMPGSENLIIAPIASHNLSVRPLIVPDKMAITLKVNSRSGKYLVTADNRTKVIESEDNFIICRSKRQLKMLKLPQTSFSSTLRNKLMWGMDKRN